MIVTCAGSLLTPRNVVRGRISINNLIAQNSNTAGIIVGLPESPVEEVTLQNITIAAKTGITIAYANVITYKISVQPMQGAPIIQKEGAKINQEAKQVQAARPVSAFRHSPQQHARTPHRQ